MKRAPPDDWLQQLRKAYPKRKGQGWTDVERYIKRHLEKGELFDEMVKGANAYRRHIATTNTEPEYIKMACTFFGRGRWWLEYDDDDCDNELTVDDTAKDCGLARQDGEPDESLKHRIGIAQTKRQYAR